MGIELRPLGVACNLACHYCYQNPQRDAGNQRMNYNLDKMKAEARRIGGRFTLFGGEPLLMRFEDLEDLFAWGLETSGGSSIQTNGVLIEDRHIDLFRRYKVSVGISIDGPGELNDARWHRTLEKTRQSTAKVESAIERLCREYQAPGLIITLHKGNAAADKLPIMADWIRRIHAIGIKNVRLHLLEVDHASVRDGYALSARENVEALLAFAEVQNSLPGMHFDLFDEMEALLEGRDQQVGCTWRACDPYTTEAVQGVEGNGQSSNCGRTNKEGIGFIKSKTAGYERYLALYRTPQADKGCRGCRFFLMCKGQCPGTAIDGDWRNRTEHCEEWMRLFIMLERRMILAGKVPLTIQPVRLEIEERLTQAWQRGENPSINRLLADWYRENAFVTITNSTPSPARISWVSETARQKWEPRLENLPDMLEQMTVHLAAFSGDQCAVRLVPVSNFSRLQKLATEHQLASAMLPAAALPNAISTHPGERDTCVFIAGTPAAVERATTAWETGNVQLFQTLLALPKCCLRKSAAAEPTALLSPLGISALPIQPCHQDCSVSLNATERFLNLADISGFAEESAWLRECLSWPVSWSELHGVAEIKTPLFRMCLQTGTASRDQLIRHIGTADEIEGGAVGLSFPYLPPSRPARLVEIAGVR